MLPKVSVIIPNYNHARYLPRRIESVLTQTLRDIEVILMDDCSTDSSRSVIEAYATKDARIRVVFNEQNSGSTFKQWNKGIELAKGEYIWLAESDDFADARLLEMLVAKMEADSAIGLAYCDSWQVDEHDQKIGDFIGFYEELDPVLWKSDFELEGKALVTKFMSFRNIIPNASAVVLRKNVLLHVGPADDTFRVNGDWVYWAKILANTKAAFVAKKLNFFRQHSNNVRTAVARNGIALLEATRVLSYISQKYGADKVLYEKSVAILTAKWLNGFFSGNISVERHLLIRQNLRMLDKRFIVRFAYYWKDLAIGRLSNSKLRNYFRNRP